MSGRKRGSELVPVSEAEIGDKIFQAYRGGESKRAIGARYNLPVREVSRVLLERVSEYRPEDRALDAFCDVMDLGEMQTKLRELFRDTDDPRTACETALAWNKLCERKGQILGTDAPRRTEGQLNLIEQPRQNSTERIRSIIDRVVAERPAPVIQPTHQPEDGQPN